MVLHPVPEAPLLVEPLDQGVVLPYLEHRARGGCRVGVELGVDLDAHPLAVVGGEGLAAHERVAPVEAPAAGAGVHLHPVVVEVEARVGSADAPHRLDGEGDPVVPVRPDARLGVRVGERRVVAPEPDAGVVPGDAGLVLDVPAHVELVVARELLEEVRGAVGAARGQLHRRRTAALRGHIGDERHAGRVLEVVVARGHLRDRAFLEVLREDHRRIAGDSLIAGVLRGEAQGHPRQGAPRPVGEASAAASEYSEGSQERQTGLSHVPIMLREARRWL
jgi:hypothetical protein